MPDYPTFLPNAGASLATSNVMSGAGRITWLERKQPKDGADNGWRVISEVDEPGYLSDGSNWRIVDFNELCEIEPALIPILDLPIGTELELVVGADGTRVWLDEETGAPIELPAPRDGAAD